MEAVKVPLAKNKPVKLDDRQLGQKNPPRYFADEASEWKEKVPPNIKTEGMQLAQKEDVRDVEKHEEMFDDVVKRSQTVLFKTKSIFPFDFFPNDLIIDITKVTVVSRSFFLSGHTQSIHIKDIFDVRVETGPFFSSLIILDLGYIQRNKVEVKFLKKKDAKLARQIIEGLVAATKAGVDLTKIPRRDLILKMPELLRSQNVPSP